MNAPRPDSRSARREGFERRIVLAFIALAHVALVVVLSRSGVIPPERIPKVLQISLLTPPEPVPPPPPPSPPRPAVAPRSVPLRPVPLAAPATVAVPAELVAPVEPTPVAPPVEPTPTAPPAPPAPPVVVPPRFDANYRDNPKPAYPPMSRRIGEEGKVLLHVFVEPDGTPGKVEIHRTSGSPRLDEAAAAAVSRWRFLPARQGDEAVAAWVIVPITFKLDF